MLTKNVPSNQATGRTSPRPVQLVANKPLSLHTAMEHISAKETATDAEMTEDLQQVDDQEATAYLAMEMRITDFLDNENVTVEAASSANYRPKLTNL